MAQPQRVGLDEALATLQAMFNGIDREVLQVVLEANSGQMERTIDVLLKMSNENDPSAKVSSSTAVSSLPDDFLSIPGSKGSDLSQVEKDELYAKMVQDELFVQELASQAQAFPEFNTFLGEAVPRNSYPEAARAARGNPNGQQAPAQQQQQNDTFKEIKEKFSSMSEAAKRKFSELATRFSRNPSRGSSTTNTNTNTNTNTRYTSLPATDEEVVAFESPDSPGTNTNKRGAYTGEIEMTTDVSSLSDKRQKKDPKVTDSKKDQ